MSLTSLEIDRVIHELGARSGQLWGVAALGYHRYALGFQGEEEQWSLTFCLQSPWLRTAFLCSFPRWKKSSHRFTALLSSTLIGSEWLGALHWEGERVLRLGFQTKLGPRFLWVRLWTGAANAFLTDQDLHIIDSAFLRPTKGEVPGGSFLPPQAQSRKKNEARDFPGEGTYSERLEEHYRRLEKSARLVAARNRWTLWLEGQRKALTIRIRNYHLHLLDDGAKDQHAGDLLMASLADVPPRAKSVNLLDWDGTPVCLPMDQEKTGIENAQAYYAKARKARERRSRATEEKDVAEIQLAALEQEAQKLADDPEGLWILDKAAKIQEVPHAGKEAGMGLRLHISGWPVLVGRNAQENEALLRGPIKGKDHWFHTRDVPGGFVFLKQTGMHPPPLQVLLDAGQLALHYSKARGRGKTDVHWTRVKYLRRVKNGPPGKVVPTQEKNLLIEPDPQRLRKLLGGEI